MGKELFSSLKKMQLFETYGESVKKAAAYTYKDVAIYVVEKIFVRSREYFWSFLSYVSKWHFTNYGESKAVEEVSMTQL